MSADIGGRIGGTCYVHKIEIKAGICLPTTLYNGLPTPLCQTLCRVMLVHDYQPHDDIVNGDMVIQDNVGTGASILAMKSLKTLGRFKILKEMELNLSVDSLQYIPPVPPLTPVWVWPGKYYRWKWTVNFKEPIVMKLKTIGATTDYDSTIVNAFHLMANCLGSDLLPNITWYSRITYSNK